MIQIDNTILSTEIFRRKFACNIKKCKGVCCVHGDSGAPLEEQETIIIKNIFSSIKPLMRKEGIEQVEQQGVYITDNDGDMVTPLVNGMECCYAIFKNGISYCVFEIAFTLNIINFKKPISCHLYPVRITKYRDFDAVNFHEWDICRHAITNGEKFNINLILFLKEPLSRKYGNEWYEKLKIAEIELIKR
jgi:hypothetical protein